MHEFFFLRKYFPYAQFAIELNTMQLAKYGWRYIFKFILLQNTF